MACAVKICGLKDEANLRAAVAAGAHYVGFVHYQKSPRHISLEHATALKKLLPNNVECVLVVVNPDDALLQAAAYSITPDYIQLHGSETVARVAEIRAQYPKQKLIKALGISTRQDLASAKDFEPLVEMLLFDAKPLLLPLPEGEGILPGGNGIAFDWKILQGFQSPTPWLLSGGLTAENVADAIRQSSAMMVDVSSGVESSAGVKEAGKIKAFIEAAHNE
jgi:phosphoribosylanthranilate isomerase